MSSAIIQTYSGIGFDILNPDQDKIIIEDIAHSLSLTCRYNGMCREFYSVAQHSVILSDIVDKEFSFEALMHDATEAYVGDIVGPLKRHIPEFIEIEHRVWESIAKKFGLPKCLSDHVKEHDKRMILTEKENILTDPIEDIKFVDGESHGIIIKPMTARESKFQFLRCFYELYEQR